VAGQADLAELGLAVLRQDGHAVEPLLTMPHRLVAGAFDVADRQGIVRALQFLQARDIRLLALKIFEQAWQARADAVDVEGDELHTVSLATLSAQSNGKAGPASATRSCVGIGDLERSPAQILDIVDLGALQQLEADWIDHETDTVGAGHLVV